MRKIHALSLALVAVFSFAAFMVASASASELLANGNIISASENLEATLLGTLALTDVNASVKPEVLCEGIFDLLIENGTLAFVNAVLMDNGELLAENALNLAGTSVAGDDIECEAMSVCTNPTLVVALNLPWHIELELSGTAYLMHFLSGTEEAGKEPEYNVDCNVPLIGLQEDVCDGLTLASLTEPVVGDVEAEFNSQEANCQLGGALSGLLVGKALLEDTLGGVTFSLS